MGNKLFVGIGGKSDIAVCDADSLADLHNLTIPGLTNVYEIASCVGCDEIYISDGSLRKIFVVHEHGGVRAQWQIPGTSWGISVNAKRNLLVTFNELRKIREYSAGGQLVKEIQLSSDMTNSWHTIQLNENRYAVVHDHRLCVVNGEGGVVKSFGSTSGSGPNQLNKPFHLVSLGGTLIVADYNNNRLMLFNANNLTVTGQLALSGSYSRIAMSDDCSAAYVGTDSRFQKIAFVWA